MTFSCHSKAQKDTQYPQLPKPWADSSPVCKTYDLSGPCSLKKFIETCSATTAPTHTASFLFSKSLSVWDDCGYCEGIKHGWKYPLPICTSACYTASVHAAVQHMVTLVAKLVHCHLHLPQGMISLGAGQPTQICSHPDCSHPVSPLQSSAPMGCLKGVLWVYTRTFAPQPVCADKSRGSCRICLEAGSISLKKNPNFSFFYQDIDSWQKPDRLQNIWEWWLMYTTIHLLLYLL